MSKQTAPNSATKANSANTANSASTKTEGNPFSQILKSEAGKNFATAEEEVLEFWDKNDVLRKSIDSRPKDKTYTFYDGPITANNKPHWGHALTMTIKDVIPRYWTMRGYRVPRSLGWDCQGIPVEYEVEKTLGFEKKEDIEEYGVAKFNKLCRESVEKYQQDIKWLTKRMGRWVNSDEEYATMDPWYIESLWWSLKELYNKGLLYEGFKVVPYSTRAGTPLSNSEVALGGYKPVVDPGITVKFKLKNEQKYILAWTTTPWTIPGNLMLAVGADFDYVEVEFDNDTYIVAKDLVEKLFGDAAEKQYKVGKSFKGSELVGKEYDPPFKCFEGKRAEGAFKVVATDYVTLEDGTGIVHQAPYGEEDFFMLTDIGIKLFDYLDDTGNFTDIVPEYKGQFYKLANENIIKDLQNLELLFDHDDYEHQMPMCWRTDTPLIYKPIKSWYVAVTKIKDLLVKENNEIHWAPDHIKMGRFGNWLENARDWALSRSRYWGTPLPVWKCGKCEHIDVLGSLAEVEEKSGVKLEDPHKPFIDEVKYKCEKCGEGEMTRIPDVIDVWYDSGAMPFARFHYPFENKDEVKNRFPAQFIAEGIDQTRGWFYTLHVLGGALFESKAFENVIVNGLFLAADGTKMSKRKKNYSEPNEVLEKFGADVVRLYSLLSPVTKAVDAAFSEKFLNETNASVLFPLWNSVKYFLSYAEIHNWMPKSDTLQGITSENIMDRWVLSRVHQTIGNVTKYMDKYDLQKSSSSIATLVDDLSKWYIRRSRDRFVSGDEGALSTLYFVLVTTAKMLAPLTPFISERIYQVLVRSVDSNAQISVHLTDWPTVATVELEILEKMQEVRDTVSLGQAARVESGLKVRQPLAEAKVSGVEFNSELSEVIKEELNVVALSYVQHIEDEAGWATQRNKTISVALDTNLSEELKKEGLYREFVRMVQNARKNAGLKMGEQVRLQFYSTDEDIIELINSKQNDLLSDVSLSEVSKNDDKTDDGELLNINDNEVWVRFERY